MKLTKGPINKIVAVYPGRFQPMGKHHKATYDWMVANFGADNSFIITSDKVCLPDSPFCFDEIRRRVSIRFIGKPLRPFLPKLRTNFPMSLLKYRSKTLLGIPLKQKNI